MDERDRKGIRVAVVGAGPAGLVSLKYCAARGYSVKCFEASASIGGTFVSKAYQGGKLVSSTTITAFSDYRWRCDSPERNASCPESEARVKDLPWHPPVTSYVEYLESYAKNFGLTEHIKFETPIGRIKASESADAPLGHSFSLFSPSGESLGTFDAVVDATGVHHEPNMPEFSGSDTFSGTILHSKDYKTPDVFDGKRVLIVGCGETAMDLAHAAVHRAAHSHVRMAIRSGFLSVPTMLGTVPLDSMITNLFESTRCHRWLERMHFRWLMTTPIIRMTFAACSGTSHGFNQWGGTLMPTKRGYHIINKSGKAMKYINAPIKQKTAWGRLWKWVDGDTGGKEIHLRGSIESISVSDVRFSCGTTEPFDLIVLATGYHPDLSFPPSPKRQSTTSSTHRCQA